MRVAVLCPGPSLPEVVPAADVVIAVNRAAVRGCDWLAAHDAPMVDEYRAQARTGVYTLPQHARATDLHAGLLAAPLREIAATCDYSKLGAFVLAAHLGATHVDVYGDDMAGTRYFSGARGPWLGEARWERERARSTRVVAALAGEGLTFTWPRDAREVA